MRLLSNKTDAVGFYISINFPFNVFPFIYMQLHTAAFVFFSLIKKVQ